MRQHGRRTAKRTFRAPARQWPLAAYLYVLHLSADELAWEYLRRNRAYQNDWTRHGVQMPQERCKDWGLRTPLDPGLDARRVHPQWQCKPAQTLRLVADDAGPHSVAFSVWHIGGSKSLLQRDDTVELDARVQSQRLSLSLAPSVHDGHPFAFAIPPAAIGPSCPLTRAAAVFTTSYRSAPGAAHERPGQQTRQHLRMLLALDAHREGATQREIATSIFGEDDTFQRWDGNGELPAQIRYLLKRGRALVESAYRALLLPNPSSRTRESAPRSLSR